MPDVYGKLVGNIYDDSGAAAKKQMENKSDKYVFDTVRIGRAEMAKSRQLARTESGAAVGIDFERGSTLRHGDILQNMLNEEMHLIIEQIPEMVMTLKFSGRDRRKYTVDGASRALVLAGHIIGNRHRPISISSDDGGDVTTLTFPIQDDSELKTFSELLKGISYHINMEISTEIFVPEEEADVHGHS